MLVFNLFHKVYSENLGILLVRVVEKEVTMLFVSCLCPDGGVKIVRYIEHASPRAIIPKFPV